MHPRTLLPSDVESKAEEKAFAALEAQLSDEWDVFHSAAVIYREDGKGAQDDECDFVLCHPERGIVVLEVKGGGIECRHGEWKRVARGGGTERMNDPFKQAADHRYSLQRKIDEVEGWRGKDLFLVHAQWFPDISVHELVLAPDAPPEIVLDRNDLDDVPAAIEKALAYHEGSREKRKAPGKAGASMLRELLAPTVRIEVPMATLFDEEEQALVELTEEQSAIFRRFGTQGRVAVVGCAGSGKTMLAVERGRRLAEAGRDVLFVCFNKALAKHLQERDAVDGLDVVHFHSLCVRWAKKAGIDMPTYDGDAPPEHWDQVLPNALVEAMTVLGPQYDDLLVDEAQDLHDHWLTALQFTLRDEASASLWLFMDDNQRVYDGNLDVPPDFLRFELNVNCRNTQAIHREVTKLYRGSVVPEVTGPEGRAPDLLFSSDPAGAVAGVIARLVEEEEVRPQDVVVLSGHGREKSAVYPAGAGKFRYTPTRGRKGNFVFFSSIRGFKGLESPVVVLCELDNLDDASRDSQLYVGLSRAKNHCVIVAPASAGA